MSKDIKNIGNDIIFGDEVRKEPHNYNYSFLKQRIEEAHNRISNFVEDTSNSSTEVVDSRYDSYLDVNYTTLSDRLNAMSTDLGDASTLTTTANDLTGAINEVNAVTTTPDASAVQYDNTASGLTATDVKNAIDEVQTNIESNATDLNNHVLDYDNPHSVTSLQTSYDNATSGLTATDVKNAIDELNTTISDTELALDGRITDLETKTDEVAKFIVSSTIDDNDGNPDGTVLFYTGS